MEVEMEDLHVQMEDISKAKQAVSAPPALLFPSLQAAVSVATRSFLCFSLEFLFSRCFSGETTRRLKRSDLIDSAP